MIYLKLETAAHWTTAAFFDFFNYALRLLFTPKSFELFEVPDEVTAMQGKHSQLLKDKNLKLLMPGPLT